MLWANFFHAYQPPNWDPAVIAKVVRESYRPVFTWLTAHPEVKITLNLAASLADQLAEHGHDDVLRLVRNLVARGQVEVVGSAYHHPLLPLVPASSAQRQIVSHAVRLHELVGAPKIPHGFFAPEMAYSDGAARTVQDAGYAWMLVDEISHAGRIGEVDFSKNYHIAANDLGVVFRNRIVSDYLYLHAILEDTDDFWRTVAQDGRSDAVLITAMDIENLGHHRPGLDAYWASLVTDSRVQPVTMSEVRSALSEEKSCTPVAASWASQESELREGVPYVLWDAPDNPLHALQWKLVNEVSGAVERHGRRGSETVLDRALYSDPFWWASAQPWWDGRIVEQGADRLIAVLEDTATPLEERQQAAKLRDEIYALVRRWNEDGTPQRRKDAYLKRTGDIRRMAGETIAPTTPI